LSGFERLLAHIDPHRSFFFQGFEFTKSFFVNWLCPLEKYFIEGVYD